MMNIELARILQADREREIEAELRSRRLLGEIRSTQIAESPKPHGTTIRPAPTRALSR
jgi:hypothetical protein